MDRNNDLENTADRAGDALRNTGDRAANGIRNAATRADDLASDKYDSDAMGADAGASGRNDAVGETTGGLAGALTGAALGSLGGPIGTIIGGIAGAVGGWWSGKEISIAASKYSDDDDSYYRSHYETSLSGDASTSASADRGSYDTVRPAYQLGHLASQNPDYSGRSFDDVEPDLQRGWTNDLSAKHGDWSRNRDYAKNAFSRGASDREQSLTLSEEQLKVGKQQVQAGEATLRKSVETEHVSQQVPVMHEEVTIERRPISADSSTNVDIGEDEIRIPLTAEEVVVEKRAVATEEVSLKKNTVTENKTVEADLRRERVDESGLRASNSDRSTTDRSTGGFSDASGRSADDLAAGGTMGDATAGTGRTGSIGGAASASTGTTADDSMGSGDSMNSGGSSGAFGSGPSGSPNK